MSSRPDLAPRAIRYGHAFAVAALLTAYSVICAADAKAAEMCWSPQELRDTEGSQSIRRDIPRAYVDVPRSGILPPPDGFRQFKGAIRRVRLPHGAPRLVALTFDLCEQPYEITGYQGRLVDYLRDNAIKATFFAGGKWMMTHAGRAQQLMSDPLFEVANHSWEHRNLRIVAGSKLDDEIRGAQAAYEQVRGQLARRQCLARDGKVAHRSAPARMGLFRFPFGACSPKALEAVAENGLLAIQWDVSSADPDRRMGARVMADSVIKSVRSGSIVLFHANGRGWNTAEALPIIVEELAKAKYQFVTVSELLNYRGAEWEYSDKCYDARPGDTDKYDGLARMLEANYERFYARFARSDGRQPEAAPIPPVPKAVTRRKDGPPQ